MIRRPQRPTPFPSRTHFRSLDAPAGWKVTPATATVGSVPAGGKVTANFTVTAPTPPPGRSTDTLTATAHYASVGGAQRDRKNTGLNSSHRQISHAAFCFPKT